MTFWDRFIKSEEKIRDVVCGMEKTKDKFKLTSQYKGKTYYFCSKVCREMFEGAPQNYAGE